MLCPLPWPSQSQLMLTSKELIPLSESHMTSCCSKDPTWTCTHTHFFPYLNLNYSTYDVMRYRAHGVELHGPLVQCALHLVDLWLWILQSGSPSRSARVECFALVWHHSFRVDNLHGADYSLGQRKHTPFYWLTAAKLLLCKRLIFAGIRKWNIS